MTAVSAAPTRVGPRRYVGPGQSIPALDGVRALAVALVLADHGGIPGLSGGFLGVDVFFVLSGFLITSLLLDEIGRTGRIGLKAFWIRRARRLLPALIVMVLAVVALSELFSEESTATLRDDAVAAFFWMSNWMFVANQTDYFAQGAPPSPLQHTWSLAVEEQYYVLWPVLIAAVIAGLGAIAYRRGATLSRRAVRTAVFCLATAGVAASATATFFLSSADNLNRVYFGTDTRVQALLVGAAAAALVVRDWRGLTAGLAMFRSRWTRWVAWALPVVGLVVLFMAARIATGSAEEFRSGLLIVVALAAILVIAPVALAQDGPIARLLSVGPLVGLGAMIGRLLEVTGGAQVLADTLIARFGEDGQAAEGREHRAISLGDGLSAQRLHGDRMCGLVIGQGLSWCKAKENEVGTIGAQDALYARARAVRIGIRRDVQKV